MRKRGKGSNGIVGFAYKKDGVTSNYYYRKNLQGDVIAVYGDNGTKYAEYVYDAITLKKN